jgi:phage repressor protein C with HTH and peptisase S24 domain
MSSKISKVNKFINSVKIKYNLRTDSDVARLFKISRQALHFWRQQGKVPDKYYRMVDDNLLPQTFENDPAKFRLPKDGYFAQAEDRRLPVIGLAKAGPDLFTDPDFKDPEETASCPAGLHDPKAYWIPVIGNSMYPYLRPYSRVCVSPNMECKSGDRVVVGLTDGQVMIAEIHFKDKKVVLKKYNDEDLTVSNDLILFCYPIIHTREPK